MSKILTKTQGLVKTLLVAVGVSVVATTTATAQTNSSSFKGVEDLKGLTVDEVKKSIKTAGDFSDQSKVLFLYNVKTGKFINAGSYWSTHISLKDYPMAFWANNVAGGSKADIEFANNMNTGEGILLGWMKPSSGRPEDTGIFIDRPQTEGTHYGWTFVAQNDDMNSYRIYTYTTNKPIINPRLWQTASEKYYLCANIGNQEKNVEAMTEEDIRNKNLTGNDTWRVLTMKQVYDLQDKNSDEMTEPLDLSFMLKSPSFLRGVQDIKSWNMAQGLNGFGELKNGNGLRFGLEKLYNKSFKVDGTNYDVNLITDNNPYTFNGNIYTDKDDYLRHMAKYFCVDVKEARCAIYQDVQVSKPGVYLIECKGYSTTKKANIFAVLLNDPTTLVKTVFNQTSDMPTDKQTALHISEQNMDYAGEEFYTTRNYINSVMVSVPNDGKTHTIRFGVMIGDANNATAENGEWTVFDDFRLLYASRLAKADLILDENRDNLNYLYYTDITYKNKPLHLMKSYTVNKWNTIVLPVNLTKDQYTKTFGTDARLATLSGLTSSQIQFKTVKMTNNMDKNEIVLEANKPYIFFPTRDMTEFVSPKYIADYGTDNKKITIAKNHIIITGVTLNPKDLKNIDQTKWVTNMTDNTTSDGTMQAFGTFARTFDPDATQKEDGTWDFSTNKGNIIADRDDLVGSYFFDGGKMYHSAERPRGLRGFSCWFKPVNDVQSLSADLYIDGISQGTVTGINSVVDFGNETGKFAKKGIYNLHGQLISNGSDTTGLPAGIYIVNGKKCVVNLKSATYRV